MWLNLNNLSVSNGIKFLSRQVASVTDPLTEIISPILEGATRSFNQSLLPDITSKSIGEIVLQTKKHGSALLETPEGDCLIEISKDKDGRFIFKAIDQSLRPVIIHEGEEGNSGILWEVQVSEYLRIAVSNSNTVRYGNVATRWNNDAFSNLKEYFLAKGILREKENRVTVKLPGEKPISFVGSYATTKAEMVIKHYYQKQSTPIEKEHTQGHLLKSLFMGYLYFSGFALAHLVRNNGLNSHQPTLSDEERVGLIATNRYFDSFDLREMAINSDLREQIKLMAEEQAEQGDTTLYLQLQGITFKPNGYSQSYEYEGTSYFETHDFSSEREIHNRKIYPEFGHSEEYRAEIENENLIYSCKKHGSDKIDVQKATFQKDGDDWRLDSNIKYLEKPSLRLPDPSFTSHLLERSQSAIIKSTFIFAASLLSKQTPALALLSTLFALVSEVRGTQIDPSNARAVRFGSIRNLKRSTDPITILNPVPNFFLQPNNPQNYVVDLSNYELANPYQNKEFYIQTADGTPLPSWVNLGMGAITPDSSIYLQDQAGYIALNKRYAYLQLQSATGDSTIDTLDLFQSKAPTPVGLPLSLNYANNLFVYKDNLIIMSGNSAGLPSLEVYNTSSPFNLTFAKEVIINDRFIGTSAQMNNFLYFLDYPDTGKSNLTIIDLDNTTNTQVVQLPVGVTSNAAFLADVDLYYAQNNGFGIMNATNPLHPIPAATVTTPSTPQSFAKYGKYLYTSNLDGTMCVSDVSNNAQVVVNNTLFMGFIANNMQLNGKYIYASGGLVTDNSPHIIVIDVFTDPLNPVIVDSIRVNWMFSFIFQNNKIYMASQWAGLTSLDASLREFTLTPQADNWGLHLFNLTTTDEMGNSVVQQVGFHVGNIDVGQIPSQQVNAGTSSTYTFDEDIFVFPNANFTYTAQQVGGLPLPNGISLNGRTFTYDEVAPGTYSIQLTGDDGWGGVASTSFPLVVEGAPVVENIINSQTAPVHNEFIFAVPQNTFSGQNLTTYALQTNGSPLPAWLTYNDKAMTFKGTPSSKDQSITQNTEINVDLWATNGVGKTKTSFVITLTGISYYAQLIAGIGYAASAIGTLSTVYYERARIINYLNRNNDNRKGEYVAYKNEPFSHVVLNPELRKELTEVKATHNGKHLVNKLPDGLVYTKGEISGIPTGEDVGRFKVKALAKHGFIKEEFELIIKNSQNEADPEPEKNWYQRTVSSVRFRKEHDVEKAKGTPMTGLD